MVRYAPSWLAPGGDADGKSLVPRATMTAFATDDRRPAAGVEREEAGLRAGRCSW